MNASSDDAQMAWLTAIGSNFRSWAPILQTCPAYYTNPTLVVATVIGVLAANGVDVHTSPSDTRAYAQIACHIVHTIKV
jgi:hypothetical protein